MGNVIGVICLVFTALVILGKCNKDDSSKVKSYSSYNSSSDYSSPAYASEPEKNWSYYAFEDEMTSKKTYLAITESINTVNFDFPYQGAQRATLKLRTHPKYGKELIFKIERGQFMCSYDGCSVYIRFDDKPATRYSATESSDNSTDTIFINNYSAFAGNMLKAKTVKIQAEFYQEGNRVFEFDVSGFDVNQYRPKQ